jgi:large subunit ribosomal protein L10
MAAAQETKRGATKVQQHKIEAKDELKQTLQSSGDVIFADFRGLTVAQITELRRSLRDQKSVLTVVKNSYARRAFQELGVGGTEDYLVGPTVVAIAERDGGPSAKVMLEFAKSSTLQVKGGYCGGKVMGPREVDALSRLPGKAELLAMLMGTMKAPVSNFVYVLNGVTQKLLRTLVAVREKKEKDVA